MTEQKVMTGLLLDEQATLTWIEVCEQSQLPEACVLDWIQHGLFGETSIQNKFDQAMLTRIRIADRLHRELELNTQGAILALELLDELSEMQKELAILRRVVQLG